VNGHLARRFSPGKDLYGKMLEAVSCPVAEWRWNVPFSPIFIQRNPEESMVFSKKMIYSGRFLPGCHFCTHLDSSRNLISSRGIQKGWHFFRLRCCSFQPQMVIADSVSGGSPKKSLQWLRTWSRRLRSILVPKSRWESWNNDDSSMT
jgi:hypothetical protein